MVACGALCIWPTPSTVLPTRHTGPQLLPPTGPAPACLVVLVLDVPLPGVLFSISEHGWAAPHWSACYHPLHAVCASLQALLFKIWFPTLKHERPGEECHDQGYPAGDGHSSEVLEFQLSPEPSAWPPDHLPEAHLSFMPVLTVSFIMPHGTTGILSWQQSCYTTFCVIKCVSHSSQQGQVSVTHVAP